MNQVQELMIKIEEIGKQRTALSVEQRALAEQVALIAATHKVGDEITMNGYPHDGKRVRITKVSGALDYTGILPRINYEAALIRKDGSNSNVMVKFSAYVNGSTGRQS